MKTYTDKQLVINYLKGDEESLETLIKRYLKPIYSFVYRYAGDEQEAEDITQDVFLKVWRNLKKFDQKKKFKTWIFSIAKNASVDFLRKSRSASGGKRTIPFSDFENEKGENIFAETLADKNPLPDELFKRAGITEVISAAINQLAPKYRMVLSARYHSQSTFREIAENLNEPLNTVKSRYRRALIILRKLLSGL